ncbi:hypothetical protein J2W17_003059 [Pseudomonas lini]|nr:hypothetical protein [Pseudomonas lini]
MPVRILNHRLGVNCGQEIFAEWEGVHALILRGD